MPLITCPNPDCGANISDQAQQCPHCNCGPATYAQEVLEKLRDQGICPECRKKLALSVSTSRKYNSSTWSSVLMDQDESYWVFSWTNYICSACGWNDKVKIDSSYVSSWQKRDNVFNKLDREEERIVSGCSKEACY